MEAHAEIEALKAELEAACEGLLAAAERGLALADAPEMDREALLFVFVQVMTLSAFQDLAGQRLDRLANLISGAATDTRPDAHLLNGPANGDGLDQAAADALFDR